MIDRVSNNGNRFTRFPSDNAAVALRLRYDGNRLRGTMEPRDTTAWWRRPLRIVRYDPLNDFSSFMVNNLDAHAHEVGHVCHANCEWVMANGGAAPGTASVVNFDSPHFEKNPTVGDRDILRDYVPVARSAGIRLIAYVNLHWFSYAFADEHPNWEQLLADGTAYGRAHPLYGGGTTLCVNTSWRDWAFRLLQEVMATGVDGVFLDGPVVFPGACYCGTCRTRFAEEHGGAAPMEADWGESWKNWIGFRERSMARFMADARDAVRSVQADGIIYCNAGGWQLGTRTARNPWRLEPAQDITGAEVFVHYGVAHESWLDSLVTAKFLSCGENPAQVFSDHALGGWHYTGMGTSELCRELFQTAAGGASPWIAVFLPALRHQHAKTLEPISNAYGRLEALEPLLCGDAGAASIAVLRSARSALHYLSAVPQLATAAGAAREQDLIATAETSRAADRSELKAHCEVLLQDEFRGWCYMLSREHLPYEVIRDEDLTLERLSRFHVLVLPNAACISDKELDAVRRFAAGGGVVVSTFETGWYDGAGNLRPAGEGGVSIPVPQEPAAFAPATHEEYAVLSEHAEGLVGFAPGELVPRPEYALRIAGPAAPGRVPLGHYLEPIGAHYRPPGGVTAFPFATTEPMDRGTVIHFSWAPGREWLRFRMPPWQALTAAILRRTPAGRVQLRTNAPATVQLELRRQPGRTLLHAVNNTGDNEFPVGEILPMPSFWVSLNAEHTGGVYDETGEPIRYDVEDGRLRFIVELRHQYTIVAIAD